MEFQMDGQAFKTTFGYGELRVSPDETQGFRPYQLLVSSIAVCSGTTLQKILAKKRLAFDDIKIQTDVERDEEQANRVVRLHIHFVIQGQGLSVSKVEKSLALAKKNCSMAQSVIDSIEVTEDFEIIEG